MFSHGYYSPQTLTTKVLLDKLDHKWFTKSRVNVLPWLLQSPDLVVMEYNGVISKKRFMAKKHTNLAELEKYSLEEWTKISAKRFQRLIESWHKILQALIYV